MRFKLNRLSDTAAQCTVGIDIDAGTWTVILLANHQIYNFGKQTVNISQLCISCSWLIFLNISSASGLPGFLSGWYLRARRRYFFLISWSVEDLGMSSSSYNELPDLCGKRESDRVFRPFDGSNESRSLRQINPLHIVHTSILFLIIPESFKAYR